MIIIKESFFHIPDWIEEISKYTGPNICKLVLANKVDLDKERKVTPQEVEVKTL